MVEKGDHGHSLETLVGQLFQANMAIFSAPEDKCVQGTPNCSFS